MQPIVTKEDDNKFAILLPIMGSDYIFGYISERKEIGDWLHLTYNNSDIILKINLFTELQGVLVEVKNSEDALELVLLWLAR